ncbi:hypothetical protein SESBI_36010 [Sesbania bispinosa]|nr:hypothetical protein SESBI_36010 [Sesbania bispinosa]
MSEVLEMVSRIVESSVSSNQQPPLKSLSPAEASQDTEVKNKKGSWSHIIIGLGCGDQSF